MSDLTGKLIANTYKDLLQIASSASNGGLDSTLRSVQDGSGNNSSLKISETSAAFTGNVSIAGSLNIGNAFTVGSIETALISATTIRGSTVSVTNITTDTLTAETLTFQDVSVSSLRTGSLTVTNNVTATAYYGDGSNLTGIASDTRIAAVSALTAVNKTSIAANASAVVALSATLETRIAAVSALTAVNKTSIAANASAVVALSATLETRIAAVSVLTATNKTSIAANASAVVALSATLETRIAAVSVLTATNKTSIAANAAAVVALSATLETRIAAVSVLTATNKTSIAANASAVVALSATLETRIAAVSVLTATNKTSITANASTIVALSATLESRIAALSATVATSISNYLPLAGGTLTGNLNFGDNDKAIFGAGSDLEIYHDGSHSYIDESGGTGNLRIKATNLVLRSVGDEDYATFIANGATTLFYDNAAKLATTSTGIDVTGNATFADNGKAIFGGGSDLQIYHDGTNNYVDAAGVGHLYLQSQGDDKDVKILSDDGAGGLVEYFRADGSIGQAQMYYYGSMKLNTTNTGIDVTGNATFADNGKAIFGAGSDLEIYHDGSNSYISDVGAGNLNIQGNNLILEDPNGVNFLGGNGSTGAVTVYYSGASRLATTSTGIDVTGDVTVTGGVYIGGTGAANLLDDYEEGTYTVQLFDATSGGNASSSSVTGTYTKIGNLVTCKFDSLNNIDTTGMTGANGLYFSLPFAAGSTGRSAGSVVFDNLTFDSGRTMVTPLVIDSAARGRFHTSGSAVTDLVADVEDINSGTSDIMTCTLTYTTA